jgi:outer membrane cobalamin receptor
MKTMTTFIKTNPGPNSSASEVAANRVATCFGMNHGGGIFRRVLCGLMVGSAILTGGCAMNDAPQNKTSLEIQAYQSRSFEVDKKTAFNSAMSVFQDLGYIVNSANLDTGFITAESPTKGAKGSEAFLSFLAGMRVEGRTAVTAFIEELSPKSAKIRLNFVERKKSSGDYGQQANRDDPIQDPKIYQSAFDKISDAIFIRSAQK